MDQAAPADLFRLVAGAGFVHLQPTALKKGTERKVSPHVLGGQIPIRHTSPPQTRYQKKTRAIETSIKQQFLQKQQPQEENTFQQHKKSREQRVATPTNSAKWRLHEAACQLRPGGAHCRLHGCAAQRLERLGVGGGGGFGGGGCLGNWVVDWGEG